MTNASALRLAVVLLVTAMLTPLGCSKKEENQDEPSDRSERKSRRAKPTGSAKATSSAIASRSVALLDDERYLQIWLAANPLQKEQPQPSKEPTAKHLGDVERSAYEARREQLRGDPKRAKALLRSLLDRQVMLVETFGDEHGLLNEECKRELAAAAIAAELAALDEVISGAEKKTARRSHMASGLVKCGVLTPEDLALELGDGGTGTVKTGGLGDIGTTTPGSGGKTPQGHCSASAGVAGGAVGNASVVVARMRGRFRACYRAGLKSNPDMHGTVTLTAKIGPKGEVLGVGGGGDGSMGPIVGCFKAVVAGAEFAPPEGGSAIVTIPISCHIMH